MIEWSDHERGFAVEYGNDDVNKTIDEFNSIKDPKEMTAYLLARPSGYVCSRWEMIPYVKMGDVLKTIGDAISKEDIIEKEMTDEESREVQKLMDDLYESRKELKMVKDELELLKLSNCNRCLNMSDQN